MVYFISGGCKNGKSMLAQNIAKEMAESKGVPLYYVATMIPVDEEDRARIKRHIAERDGWGFKTLEEGRSPAALLNRQDVDLNGVFLVDSVTALLSNEMFPYGEPMNLNAAEKLKPALLEFAEAVNGAVFVSDYIYSDADRFDEYTEKYRQGLAYLDKALANVADEVIEVSYGINYYYKEGCVK